MRNVFSTAKFQQEFEQKGYVVMPLLSAEEISFVLSKLQLMKPDDNFNPAILPGQTSSHITDLDTNTEYKRQAKKLITNILTPHVEKIFDDYKILNPNFIVKPPGKGRLSIHQDWTFVSDPESYTSLTLWCPLIDTNESNGTLQVVEASYKIVSNITTSTIELYCKDFESAIVENYSKYLCLKAGECVIFDQSILLFSGDNRTTEPRYVMQAIIIPAEVDPVFYFFDRQSPEKGFEVFQIEPDFFIYQDFSRRPFKSKSLGFVKNENKFLTEDEFISRIKHGHQTRKIIDLKIQKIYQELEHNGYAVIEFLDQSEVQYLLNFDQTNPPPDDLVAPGMSFSINTSELLYRRLITEEIKKKFTPKLITHFLNYKIVLCNFIRKKANKLLSAMPLHQDPSLVDEFSQQSFAVWCPLVDVDEQNGCLQVVKKSHLLSSRIRPFSTFDGFPYSQDILSLMREKYLTSIPMKAGQALIYDKRLFHCSPPNLTTVERVTAVCSLVPENILTRFYYREAPTSNKVELFEVQDEFYDRYIIGEKPEGVKSLGIFDYEVEPLTPEILMEKLEEDSKFPSINNQVLSPQSQSWMLTAQQLQDELTQTQAELTESNEQLHQTQEELETLKIQQFQTQTELEQSQTQLQAELTESNARMHQKTQELQALQEEYAIAQLELEQEREKLHFSQAELEQDREQLHLTQDQLEELKIQQSQTQTELEQSRQQLQQTRAQLQQSEWQLHQTQTELEQSQIQLHQKTVELEKVKSQQHQTRLAEIIRGRYP